ncbi:MAG: NPCBM/NEW2 domain-containing protein [Armatimonadetes bacterium]|nr:NPCBM/NEW2 domain-containing protein [Armatimonadota bacterium]
MRIVPAVLVLTTMASGVCAGLSAPAHDLTLPAGKTWAEMNGPVRLVTDSSCQGREYEHSIYGESVFEATWDIGGRYRYFVAAAGLGTPKPDASVEFIVKVDGEERFNSGVFRPGMPVMPVLVDVTGARRLTLITTDGGDSIRNDYAWWGEARLITP